MKEEKVKEAQTWEIIAIGRDINITIIAHKGIMSDEGQVCFFNDEDELIAVAPSTAIVRKLGQQ